MKEDESISIWMLVHAFITDPECRHAFFEGWKEGWNSVKTDQSINEVEQLTLQHLSSTITKNNEEPFLESDLRPDDLWEEPPINTDATCVPAGTSEEEFVAESFPRELRILENTDCMEISPQVPVEDSEGKSGFDTKDILDRQSVVECNSQCIDILCSPQASLEDLWKISPEEEETSGSYFQYNFISQDVRNCGHQRCLM